LGQEIVSLTELKEACDLRRAIAQNYSPRNLKQENFREKTHLGGNCCGDNGRKRLQRHQRGTTAKRSTSIAGGYLKGRIHLRPRITGATPGTDDEMMRGEKRVAKKKVKTPPQVQNPINRIRATASRLENEFRINIF
jgi:hypothetical protein